MFEFEDERSTRRGFLGAGAGAIALALPVIRGGVGFAADGDTRQVADGLVRKAVAFLPSLQEPNGGFSTKSGPGITGIVVTALLRTKKLTPAEPVVAKALAYLEGEVAPKGTLEAEGPQSNYVTAVAMMAFQEANVRGRYDALVKSGQTNLKRLQWDEGEKKGRDDAYYGGAGYGGKSRPDLSNTAFFVEALRDSGVPADDPNLQKAIVFISRCQNMKSEFNDQPWADKVNDGGFIYSAADGGISMAGGAEPSGALRSYASMTYAGLKSMVHAGLTAADPRVKAAYDYIKKNYSVDENPGLGKSGLYYYYQTMARALSLLGKPTLVDSAGVEHDWRGDITAALAKRQGSKGEWVNTDARFMEGNPALATSFALLALSYAHAAKN